MKIIKLNAIDSTSSFLKELAKNSTLENFTVVTANQQTKGRGQQHSNWVSEPFKNLTMSVFIKDLDLNINDQKYLNFAISLAILDVLNNLNIDKLAIKWPNDIMSANKKICGILIENSLKNDKIYASIVGVGLNVNQVDFPKFLKNASSLKIITKTAYSLEDVLQTVLQNIKKRIQYLLLGKYNQLEKQYLSVLYKKNIPTMFKDSKDVLFMGKIIGISKLGNLLIELENESIKEFRIKEITLA